MERRKLKQETEADADWVEEVGKDTGAECLGSDSARSWSSGISSDSDSAADLSDTELRNSSGEETLHPFHPKHSVGIGVGSSETCQSEKDPETPRRRIAGKRPHEQSSSSIITRRAQMPQLASQGTSLPSSHASANTNPDTGSLAIRPAMLPTSSPPTASRLAPPRLATASRLRNALSGATPPCWQTPASATGAAADVEDPFACGVDAVVDLPEGMRRRAKRGAADVDVRPSKWPRDQNDPP